MGRPPCCRRVAGIPGAPLFKPAGIPARFLDEVIVTLDEFEAIRLADKESLHQAEAASRMGISRATFGRILESAHRKVADVLTSGKLLRLEGGPVEICPRDTREGPRPCRRRAGPLVPPDPRKS